MANDCQRKKRRKPVHPWEIERLLIPCGSEVLRLNCRTVRKYVQRKNSYSQRFVVLTGYHEALLRCQTGQPVHQDANALDTYSLYQIALVA
jgi:hypothetical protein